MLRVSITTICLLAGFMDLGQPAQAANAPGPRSSKLERTAEHVFQLADADKSGALNRTEQAQADLRAEKAIRQLVHDNAIGGLNRLAAAIDPQLADPDAMTAPEFIQHFAALAARHDTALRTCRMAKFQTCCVQPAVGQTPLVVTVREPGRDRYYDDRFRERRNDLDDRNDRDRRYYSSPQPVSQPQPFAPGPQPVATAPVHRDTPAPAHHESGGGHHESGGGRHDLGGGHHDSGGKHEPPHVHDSPKGGSHGHSGFHVK